MEKNNSNHLQAVYTSYRISACDVHALVYMYLQKLMNVWKEIISVHRTVTTLLVHTSAPVTVVLSLMLMERLVMVRLYTYYHNSMNNFSTQFVRVICVRQ